MRMLYIIGLGLNDEKDISMKGLDALRQCDEVYCEMYTNKWSGSLKALEDATGKNIIIIEREKSESDFLVDRAQDCITGFLVPGDPFSATTHFEIFSECRRRGVHAEVIHSSSVFTAVACTGMDLYKFGRTTTLPKGFDPQSPYEMIKENKRSGLHTLVLMDTGMTAKEGIEVMVKHGAIQKDGMVVVCIRLGNPSQKIIYDSADNIIKDNIADVPCCIVVPGKLNEKEEEFLELWKR
ncbi:MAG: diphthine synthase [Candidatus Aenigmarchaeota archaeon]|nr:diphthine synthase [Candidatus Aenigmarchaeota archaeon]